MFCTLSRAIDGTLVRTLRESFIAHSYTRCLCTFIAVTLVYPVEICNFLARNEILQTDKLKSKWVFAGKIGE